MIIEISAAAASVSFIVLTIFLIVWLQSAKKSLKQIQSDIKHLSTSGLHLIDNANQLTEDIQKKSDSLNFLFRLLPVFKKKEEVEEPTTSEKITEIVEIIGSGIQLVKKIKGDIKKYVK